MGDEVVEDGAAGVVVKKGVGSFIYDFYLSSLNWDYLASNTVTFRRISSPCPREYSTKGSQVLSHFTFQKNNINQPQLPKDYRENWHTVKEAQPMTHCTNFKIACKTQKSCYLVDSTGRRPRTALPSSIHSCLTNFSLSA